MTIRVIVNGAHGKMGRLACETIRQHDAFSLVGELSRQDNLSKAITDTGAEVVVDLTRADAVYENSLTIIQQGARPVIGTSGLKENQIDHLQQLCAEKTLGGLIVPNFSIAAVLMMTFAAQAARYLSHAAIIEAHHPQKFDAPSGTAVKTAAMIAQNRRETPETSKHHQPAQGELHHGIPIHALRLPGVLANQQVIFGQVGETLTISHETLDRNCFMPGVVLSCQEVMRLSNLQYGLESVLGLA